MININRIIKLVKKGMYYCNAFGLNKKAQGFMEEDMADDAAAQWLAQQEKTVAPVPSDVSVQTPSQQIPQGADPISDDISQRMDRWVTENGREIGFEGSQDIITLIDKKNNAPSDSYLSPDFILYKDLISNPQYKGILSDKINMTNPSVDKQKADLFVETMLAKTQKLLNEMKDPEGSSIMTPQPVESPVEAPVEAPVEDEKIQFSAYERFMPSNLSDEEKKRIFETVGMAYDGNMLSKAVEQKLGSPKKPGHLDQRMNFFLRYPEMLQNEEFNVLRQVPNLEQSLREGLRKFGIADDNIIEALKQAYSNRSAKRPITEILKREAGDYLLNILQTLIDRADPAIAEWFKSSLLGGDVVSGAHYTGTTEEGKAMEGNLSGATSADVSELNVTEEDMDETSKKIAGITTRYLANQLEEMGDLQSVAIQSMMHNNSDEYKKMASLIPSSSGDDKKGLQKKMDRELKRYTGTERLNAFSTYAIRQLSEVFQTLGKGKKIEVMKGGVKAPSVIEYNNRKGTVSIPLKILRDIYGVEDRDRSQYEGLSIDDYGSYVDLYKKRINEGKVKDYFKAPWKSMLNYRLAYDSYADMGKVKSQIKDLAKRGGNPDSIQAQLEALPESAKLLELFSGISGKDSVAERSKKKGDFIYMTLNQTPEQLSKIYDAYKSKKVYDKKRQELKAKGLPPSELRVALRKMNKEESTKGNIMHSLKTHIGDVFYPILPSIVNNIQKAEGVDNFKSQAMKGFVDLFDHNPIQFKEFTKIGRNPNPYDSQGRSNTELYYLARGEEVPEHVKQLMEIKNQGLMESGKKSFEKGGWYDKFFKLYEKFNYSYRRIKAQESLINNEIENKDKYIENVMNARAKKILNNSTKFEMALKKVPAEQSGEFRNNMSMWDGTTILPDNYYKWLGQNQTLKVRDKIDIKLQEMNGKLSGIQKEAYKVKVNLSKMLADHHYKFDLSALKLASIEYSRLISRIKKLSEIKQSSYKFAFINTSLIDDTIRVIETDFDDFFDDYLR